jgi:hypothetical protein
MYSTRTNLELSGRTLADGTDEESAYAARMDIRGLRGRRKRWRRWKGQPPGVTARLSGCFLLVCSFFPCYVCCKGVLRPPMTCAQRTCGGRWMMVRGISLCLLCFIGTYPLGMTPFVCEKKELGSDSASLRTRVTNAAHHYRPLNDIEKVKLLNWTIFDYPSA